MKKQTIWILAIVMAIVFIGLLCIQIFYMRNIVQIRYEQFAQGVRQSLVAVSQHLEQDEARHYLEDDVRQVEMSKLMNQYIGEDANQSGIKYSFTTRTGLEANLTIKGASSEISNLQTGGGMGVHYRSMQDAYRNRYLYQRDMLDEVILNIISKSSNRPITDRADSARVRRYLRQELDTLGLKVPFEFAIANHAGTVMYKSPNYKANTADHDNMFIQALFPNDVNGSNNYLKVYFPTKNDYIFSSISFMVPAFAFTLILLIIFIYTIVVAFRQKKLTEMKNDFINNMTHELKTPISSLSLAGQMLGDASVRKSDTMMRHIAEVINDDTKRLRFMVEKVLQMSLYYNQKSVLNLVALDANKVIAAAAHSVKLRVEKVGGRIELDLAAGRSLVKVDEMHFANLITNLLDNAVKYRSEEHPLILKIATEDLPHNKLQITVTDTGIGIRKDDLRKIFDKFFRVSTGDRHDVKGFGLGLAYVKKMVEEFGGEITAESEFGRGTTFTLTLPLAPDQE